MRKTCLHVLHWLDLPSPEMSIVDSQDFIVYECSWPQLKAELRLRAESSNRWDPYFLVCILTNNYLLPYLPYCCPLLESITDIRQRFRASTDSLDLDAKKRDVWMERVVSIEMAQKPWTCNNVSQWVKVYIEYNNYYHVSLSQF